MQALFLINHIHYFVGKLVYVLIKNKKKTKINFVRIY